MVSHSPEICTIMLQLFLCKRRKGVAHHLCTLNWNNENGSLKFIKMSPTTVRVTATATAALPPVTSTTYAATASATTAAVECHTLHTTNVQQHLKDLQPLKKIYGILYVVVFFMLAAVLLIDVRGLVCVLYVHVCMCIFYVLLRLQRHYCNASSVVRQFQRC